MGRWNRFLYVLTAGFLALATTSFAEDHGLLEPKRAAIYNNYDYGPGLNPYNPYYYPYQNHRPTVPQTTPYYGGMGGGTIANPGGGMGGMGGYYGGLGGLGGYNYGGNLFNPYFYPYFGGSNQSPFGYGWGQGAYNQPYYGLNGVPWQWSGGLPGLGYNLGGLGSSGFYDYGLGGLGGGGFSPWLGGYNDPYYGYDPYGLGLGYGDWVSPYDYVNGGFNYDPFWSNVGFGDGLSSWWY